MELGDERYDDCVWGGIGETAVDTTIVRLLCVRTASLSGRILDRSYYIYIISTKPTTPLPSPPTPHHHCAINLIVVLPHRNLSDDDDDDDECHYTFYNHIYIYHQQPHPRYLPHFEQCSGAVISLYLSLNLYIYIYIHQTTFVYHSDGKSLLRDRGPMNLINWQRWYGADPASDGPGKQRVHDLYIYIFPFQRNNLHRSFVVRG